MKRDDKINALDILKDVDKQLYFFSSSKTRLYMGDSIEIMSKIPGNSIDLIFADPPYNLSNGGFTCKSGKMKSVDKGDWDKSNGFIEDFEFHKRWIKECYRILRPDGSLWISGTKHSIFKCGFVLDELGMEIINDICWIKPNPPPLLSCSRFCFAHEILLWAYKSSSDKTNKKNYTFDYNLMRNGDWQGDIIKAPNKQMKDVWSIKGVTNREKAHGKHPTQKPEALLERIILSTSKEGDIILDPFCGSGTTGVVANFNGRKFIGIDKEKEYLKIARLRLLEAIVF